MGEIGAPQESRLSSRPFILFILSILVQTVEPLPLPLSCFRSFRVFAFSVGSSPQIDLRPTPDVKGETEDEAKGRGVRRLMLRPERLNV
jgi:hypothetical protein